MLLLRWPYFVVVVVVVAVDVVSPPNLYSDVIATKQHGGSHIRSTILKSLDAIAFGHQDLPLCRKNSSCHYSNNNNNNSCNSKGPIVDILNCSQTN